MSNSLTKKLFLFALTALILVYVAYLFYSSNFTMLQTEIVYNISVEDTIDTLGYIVRNENVIEDTGSGVVAYALDNGEKINNGGVIARFYNSTQDTADMQEIEHINTEIAELEKLNKAAANLTTNVESIDNQINNEFVKLMHELNSANYISARRNQNLLYYINERQLVTGELRDLTTRINKLKKRRAELQNSASGSIGAVYAPVSGYFINHTDGYEDIIDYDKITKVYPEDFDEIKQKRGESGNRLGKIVENTDWYILCKVSAEQALKITESGKTFFNLYIPFAVSGTLPVELYSVNQVNKNGPAVIVLRCNRVNSETTNIRAETVQLAVTEYSGLRISKRALHDSTLTKKIENEDGSVSEVSEKVQGVYVQYGNELIFKQLAIIYSGTDYVICDPDPDNELLFNGETVELYDKIIVEGTDLYDGKIVN